MTVTELREALQKLEADGKGGLRVLLWTDPYLRFDRVAVSDGLVDGKVHAFLVDSDEPGPPD